MYGFIKHQISSALLPKSISELKSRISAAMGLIDTNLNNVIIIYDKNAMEHLERNKRQLHQTFVKILNIVYFRHYNHVYYLVLRKKIILIPN